MAFNPLLGDDARPDQARLTHTHVGLISPIWLPFMAAAGIGAAWWTMTHWARVMGSGYPGASASRPNEAGASAPPQPSVPQASAPVPQAAAKTAEPAASQLESALSEQPIADALSESLAVQGDDAPAPAEPAPAAPPETLAKPVATATPVAKSTTEAAAPKPDPEPAAAPVAATSGTDDDHPAPTLPPHEGLPARRKGGGKKKSG